MSGTRQFYLHSPLENRQKRAMKGREEVGRKGGREGREGGGEKESRRGKGQMERQREIDKARKEGPEERRRRRRRSIREEGSG
jgi:hypothetical protein